MTLPVPRARVTPMMSNVRPSAGERFSEASFGSDSLGAFAECRSRLTAGDGSRGRGRSCLGLSSLFVGAAVACTAGGGQLESVRDRGNVPPPEDADPETIPSSDVVFYELHEWGVVTRPIGVGVDDAATAAQSVASLPTGGERYVEAADGTVRRRRSPPTIRMVEQTVDKPLIWVHPKAGQGPFHLKLIVATALDSQRAHHDEMPPPPLDGDPGAPMGGAVFVEAWPSCETGGDLGWTRCAFDVEVTPGACPYAALPEMDAAHCMATVDGRCEAAELATVETADAACLHAPQEANALLYRLASSVPAEWIVTSNSATSNTALHFERSKAPGASASMVVDVPLLRIHRAKRRADSRVDSHVLAASQTGLDLPAPTGADISVAMTWIDDGLRSRGLSHDEIAAFHRAWDDELFGPASSGTAAANGSSTDVLTVNDKSVDGIDVDDRLAQPPGVPTEEELVLAWMGETELVQNARIIAEPGPTATKRASLIVWRGPTRPMGVNGNPADRAPMLRAETDPTPVSAEDAVVRKVIRTSLSSIDACYADALKASPTLSGSISVSFTIDVDGSVDGATASASSIADPSMNKCVVDRVSKLKFPKPASGSKTYVTYPFRFKLPDE